MKIIDSLKLAVKGLRANKLRTALTVMGIVIGITAVIVVLSVGNGLKKYMLDQIEIFGTDVIEVEIKVPNVSKTSSENAMGIASGINITSLKESDAEAIKELPNIKDVYAGIMGQEIVTYHDKNKRTFIWGANSSLIDIDRSQVEHGRFFSDSEDKGLTKVVVLGKDVKENLFGESDSIGKYVKIGRFNFKVIGVMEERGSVAFFNMDDFVFIPLRTYQKQIMGVDHIQFLMAQLEDASLVDQTAEEITFLMRDRHDISNPDKDDFAVTSMVEAREMLDVIFGGITLLLIALVAVSLVVGGVGIMNIMYVIVSERTHEIGLRKAVGAKRHDILFQFLWEAVVITFSGGLIGIIFGIVISLLITVVAGAKGFLLGFGVSIFSIILACSFSILVGLIFGIYPARRAARLDPIKALRYE